jgi:hypothetical protein
MFIVGSFNLLMSASVTVDGRILKRIHMGKFFLFSITHDFAALIMIETAPAFHLLPQSGTGAVEPDLDGVEAYIEDCGNFCVGEFFEFAEQQDSAVVFGQLVDHAANAGGHLPADILTVGPLQTCVWQIVNRSVVIE